MGRLLSRIAVAAISCALLAACSDAGVETPCERGCAEDESCDLASGLCLAAPGADRGTANLAPRFDVGLVEDRIALLAYDRVLDRLLYGEALSAGADMAWQTLLVGLTGRPESDPPLALVAVSGTPVIFAESESGRVVRGRLLAGTWQWDEVALFESRLEALDAVWVPDTGYHVVAVDEERRSWFLSLDGGTVSDPEAIAPSDGTPALRSPVTLVRMAGRTTLFAAGASGGFFSITREGGSWSTATLCAEADVAAVAAMQTPAGMLTLFLDRTDGGLYQVRQDDLGNVTVLPLALGLLADPTGTLPVRIGAAAGSGETPAWLAVHDAPAGTVRLFGAGASWQWEERESVSQETPFLPALVALPDRPALLGIDLGDDGKGPGFFDWIEF